MSAVSQAVAVRESVDRVVTWLESAGDDYGRVLPGHLDPSHWLRLATGVLRKDQRLAEVAVKNPDSFKHALLECARLGHEPGTDHFALVTYGNEVVGIEQYQGEIDRMYRAGAVESVVCEVVRRDDMFQWQPGKLPDHDADWFAPAEERGPMVGVYAFARLKGGGYSKVVVMGAEEVGKHRDVARTDIMWKKWPDAMWRKTAIHELRKWVPTSASYRAEHLRAMAATEQVRPTIVRVEQVPVNTTTGEVLATTEEEQ